MSRVAPPNTADTFASRKCGDRFLDSAAPSRATTSWRVLTSSRARLNSVVEQQPEADQDRDDRPDDRVERDEVELVDQQQHADHDHDGGPRLSRRSTAAATNPRPMTATGHQWSIDGARVEDAGGVEQPQAAHGDQHGREPGSDGAHAVTVAARDRRPERRRPRGDGGSSPGPSVSRPSGGDVVVVERHVGLLLQDVGLVRLASPTGAAGCPPPPAGRPAAARARRPRGRDVRPAASPAEPTPGGSSSASCSARSASGTSLGVPGSVTSSSLGAGCGSPSILPFRARSGRPDATW